MPKGGPLSFLNKKTWHPGRVQNMEEVWKREQAAAKEDQKLADLRKQIAEERAREELHSMAQAAGVQVHSDRLDWMYQGGVMARQEANQRMGMAAPEDAQLAGAEPASASGAGAAQLPSFYTTDTPASANEMWQRLHADPLFAMKQQEQSMRRSILANPVQVEAIKSKVRELKPEKEEKKKKHKKHHRKRRSPSPWRGSVSPRRRSPPRPARRHSDRSRSRSRSRSRDPDPQRDGRGHDRRCGSPTRRRRSPTPPGTRPAAAKAPPVPLRRDGTGDHSAGGPRREGRGDGATAQGGGVQYGINYARHTAESSERSKRAEETRRHLERAAERQEEERRAAAAAAGRRHVEYRAGRLTEEERAARLASMTSAAAQHDADRAARVQDLRDRQQAEESEVADRRVGSKAEFLEATQKEVFGGRGSDGLSVADTVNRRKHFNQRGAAAHGAAFRR